MTRRTFRGGFFFAAGFALVSALHAVDVSTATGDVIRFDGRRNEATIEGNARVESATATLTADKIIMNNTEKQGHAVGNVVIRHGSGTIKGSDIEYDWGTSAGVIRDAVGFSPPWRFSAERMVQDSPGYFKLVDGELTSCEEDPPHYRFRSGRAKVRVRDRAKTANTRFLIDELPALWMPYYTRSLVPKKYSIRVEPGSSGRDGLILKNRFGYPLTPNSYTKVKWDYLQYTGNGIGLDHRYSTARMSGNTETYYIRDYNPDPQPQSRRFSTNWNHWQKFTDRLTANSKIDLKSDQSFGNEFSGAGNEIRVENQQRGLLSEAGLNYQFPKATIIAEVDRRDRFDSTVSSKNFVGKVTAPRITFNTIPLRSKAFPFYTDFSGGWTNETLDRFTPRQALQYQRTAFSAVQMRRDLRLSRSASLTPRFAFRETWQDRDLTKPNSTNDLYTGRYNTGTDLRLRVLRVSDVTVGYNYAVRLKPNRMDTDQSADDRGVESSQFSTNFITRVGRNSRVSLTSGYDVRDAPRSNSQKYHHEAARITPPSLDVQWEVNRKVNILFRETYQFYDAATDQLTRRPLNTSAEIQYGNLARAPFFSQGFSYSRPAPGQETALHMTNKLRFYLTPKWYVDLFATYRAVASERMNYRKIFPIEKTVRVARDLHCWVLRMEFSERPGRKEASFYIDLKANMVSQRNMFNAPEQKVYDSYQSETMDVSEIFPLGDPTEHAPPAPQY